MEGLLTMSQKEIKRIKILEQIDKKDNDRRRIRHIKISRRQTYRLLKSYREEGEKGLIHSSRGKASN